MLSGACASPPTIDGTRQGQFHPLPGSFLFYLGGDHSDRPESNISARGCRGGEIVAGQAGMGLVGDPVGRVGGPPVLVGVVGKNLICSVVM